MSKDKDKIIDIISGIEKISFFSNITEKERPPVSPVPTETRELARRSYEDFVKKVEKAKNKALESQKAVDVDGARLSGVKSGDIWHIDKDGIIGRSFEPNEGLLEGLLQRRTERVADPDKDVDLELLLKVLSFSQWAPNATNEQPTKILIYKKDHPSMDKIGNLMKKALEERIVPNINIRNFIINKKRETPNFLPDISMKDLTDMDDKKFSSYRFEEMSAPLNELPQTTAKLLERNKIVYENGKYYNKLNDGSKGSEYTLKDLLLNDVIFTKGMGKFFLKFKNTHPYLIVVLRKWHYTSLMTETLYKYGIQLPDVGEEFIDAGFYSDYLALSARGFGLSGVVKTGPMDLAKDELTELFIDDLKEKLDLFTTLLNDENNLIKDKKRLIQMEIEKIFLIFNGLKYGLEAMRCKEQNRPMRDQLIVALKRGEVYVPATFFQLGYPLIDPEERIKDPRQGKDPLDKMMILM
ncbi:MAG: nitroreductase family protein [Spirochaetes bacterium]|nr:nitroreductase family protein [Spirochaetota bacterium]